MRPNAAPLTAQYACRCGKSHSQVARIFIMVVLACPAVAGDGLHLVADKTPYYLVTGDGTRPEGALTQQLLFEVGGLRTRMSEIEARLEAVLKRKMKEPKA